MEPLYIYITVLVLLATKLIYDSTVRQTKANILYFKINDKRPEIDRLINKSIFLAKEIINIDKIDQCYENLRTYRQLQLDLHHIINDLKDLEIRLKIISQHIPNYSGHDLDYELTFVDISIRKEREIAAAHTNFLKSTKFHVIVNYTPHSLPFLKVAEYILNEVGDLKLAELELEIDPTTMLQTLEKLELNKKLKEKLPPKAKAKVNKI